MLLTTTSDVKADPEMCRGVNMGLMKNLIGNKMKKNKNFMELKMNNIGGERAQTNKKVVI